MATIKCRKFQITIHLQLRKQATSSKVDNFWSNLIRKKYSGVRPKLIKYNHNNSKQTSNCQIICSNQLLKFRKIVFKEFCDTIIKLVWRRQTSWTQNYLCKIVPKSLILGAMIKVKCRFSSRKTRDHRSSTGMSTV